MIKIPYHARLILGSIAAISFTAFLPNQANGQVSRLEVYLKSADKNLDGIIEPGEMPTPVKHYLESKGRSTNSRMKISDILRIVPKKQQPASPNSSYFKSSKPGDLKVPKFGVEASKKTGLQTFAPVTETIQYSKAVISKAQRILRKYDRDGSNFLEPEEISRGNWGAPEIYSHDKNGDRRLSLTELQDRYHLRNIIQQKEQQIQKVQEELSKSTSSEGGGLRGKAGRQTFNGRQRFPSRESFDSNRFRSEVTTKKTDGSSASDYANYVMKYIVVKDTNKNGMIDGDEMDKVRSPSKYDTNGDGKIERQEMIAALTKSSKKSASKSNSSKTSGSLSSRKSSSPFGKLDTNNDRLVQMHEFSKKWTAKKLDEFLAKDTNGDGVISPSEW